MHFPAAPRILFAQAQESNWFRVYETHPLGQFRRLSFVDEFLKLLQLVNDLLALGAGELLVVYGKEDSPNPHKESRTLVATKDCVSTPEPSPNCFPFLFDPLPMMPRFIHIRLVLGLAAVLGVLLNK